MKKYRAIGTSKIAKYAVTLEVPLPKLDKRPWHRRFDLLAYVLSALMSLTSSPHASGERFATTLMETTLDSPIPELGNVLLSSFKAEEAAWVRARLLRSELMASHVLERSYEDIEGAFFPVTGVLSVNATTRSGFTMQVAMIGSEGASGTTLVLGNQRWAHTTIAQVDTVGWLMKAEDFLMALSRSRAFRNAMLRYTGVVAGQMASAALANGRCTVPQRLARWILQMQGRLRSDEIEITHDEISEILGSRRSGITTALHLLEGNHLIRSTRGRVEILDREGLIAASNGSYRDGD